MCVWVPGKIVTAVKTVHLLGSADFCPLVSSLRYQWADNLGDIDRAVTLSPFPEKCLAPVIWHFEKGPPHARGSFFVAELLARSLDYPENSRWQPPAKRHRLRLYPTNGQISWERARYQVYRPAPLKRRAGYKRSPQPLIPGRARPVLKRLFSDWGLTRCRSEAKHYEPYSCA